MEKGSRKRRQISLSRRTYCLVPLVKLIAVNGEERNMLKIPKYSYHGIITLEIEKVFTIYIRDLCHLGHGYIKRMWLTF
jgi:hypothetical protein